MNDGTIYARWWIPQFEDAPPGTWERRTRMLILSCAMTGHMFACMIVWSILGLPNGDPLTLAWVLVAEFYGFLLLGMKRWMPWVEGKISTTEFLGSLGITP